MRGGNLTWERLGERVWTLSPAPLGAAEQLMVSPPAWLADAWGCGDRLALELARDVPRAEIEALLDAMARETPAPREVVIPTVYDGPDLEEVAARLGISPRELVELHAGALHTCAFLGFCPGFGYLDGLPTGLAGLPRRPSPRTRIPAGSVAIAGARSAVYPLERPGGWWLLGRTETPMVDVGAGRFTLRAGDRVRFRAVE